MKPSPRKTNFVDPQVQGELARHLVIHWLIFLGAVAGLAFGVQWLSEPFRPFGVLAAETWSQYGLILMVLVCLAPIFVYDSIRFSHRFAGPISRIRQVCNEMANGKTPEQLELRSSDFWRDLAHDINQVADRLTESKTTAGPVVRAGQESKS